MHAYLPIVLMNASMYKAKFSVGTGCLIKNCQQQCLTLGWIPHYWIKKKEGNINGRKSLTALNLLLESCLNYGYP